MRAPAAFPFAAVAGMEAAKRALLLLSIEPALKGVLIAAGPGAGKSLLARSFRSLFPALPWVELPLGTTEDRLLGGLDLERTLATGRRHFTAGLLGRAHGGVVYVDGVNLLDRSLTRHLAAALNAGTVSAMIGTYDPGEGTVDGALADSVAIRVVDSGELSREERADVLGRVAAFDRDPVAFARRHSEATALLRRRIDEARWRLGAVDASAAERRRLSEAALSLGVEGNRADIFALAAARAHAAFMGRTSLDDEDLEAAVELVLMPRAGAAGAEGGFTTLESEQPTPEPEPAVAPEDCVMAAIDCAVPEDVLRLPDPGSNRHPGRGAKSPERPVWNRGRGLRTVAARPGANKIALVATILAAAPRRQAKPDGPVIQITASDLRFKQFRQNASIRILFAVDSSGSMAMNRIEHAKGAVTRLLGRAYLDRDEIALIGFRGSGAEVLLPPSRSVERARRALEALPVGGGTPLAAGLEAALLLTERARPSSPRDTLLVVLTDGRANVPRRPQAAIWPDIERVCAGLKRAGVVTVVIDTSRREVSRGDAERLAGLLGGRAVHLPRANPDSVYEAVAAEAAAMRGTRMHA